MSIPTHPRWKSLYNPPRTCGADGCRRRATSVAAWQHTGRELLEIDLLCRDHFYAHVRGEFANPLNPEAPEGLESL